MATTTLASVKLLWTIPPTVYTLSPVRIRTTPLAEYGWLLRVRTIMEVVALGRNMATTMLIIEEIA